MKLSKILILILTLVLLSSCASGADPGGEKDDSIQTGLTPGMGGADSDNSSGTNNKTEGDNMNDDTDKTPSDSTAEVTMTARVDKVSDLIEVTVIEAEYGNTGTFWVLTSPTTQVIDKDGEVVGACDIVPGDTVRRTYSGQVMMSYPPRISAVKIEII